MAGSIGQVWQLCCRALGTTSKGHYDVCSAEFRADLLVGAGGIELGTVSTVTALNRDERLIKTLRSVIATRSLRSPILQLLAHRYQLARHRAQ
jgi:hypothetical protein